MIRLVIFVPLVFVIIYIEIYLNTFILEISNTLINNYMKLMTLDIEGDCSIKDNIKLFPEGNHFLTQFHGAVL